MGGVRMEWKEVKIGDFGQIITGKTPKTAIKENWGGKIPFLSPSDDMTNKTSPVTARTITELGVAEVAKCLIPINSVCVSCIGSDLGKVVKTDRELVTNQQINTIVPHSDIDSDFVYYLMCIVGKELNYISKTSTAVPIINKSTFSDWDVVIPEKVEDQRRIASILSSLDRKIELNNKINADLEEMAQAIFKNWFVDFKPFKDGKFVESELGMIPEGWKVSQIIDIPHILETGRRPKGGAVEEGIPSVGAEHVKGMCSYDYSKTKYINAEFASKLKSGKIKGYELLIYKDGGKPGYFIPNFSIFGEGYPFEECYLNEHVFKLDFNGNKGFNIFCYFFFKTKAIMKYLNAQGAKAAIPGINKKDIEYIYILSPNNDAVRDFGIFALPLFKKILQNANENLRLSHLRDTLLPKLMSGELEVSE